MAGDGVAVTVVRSFVAVVVTWLELVDGKIVVDGSFVVDDMGNCSVVVDEGSSVVEIVEGMALVVVVSSAPADGDESVMRHRYPSVSRKPVKKGKSYLWRVFS